MIRRARTLAVCVITCAALGATAVVAERAQRAAPVPFPKGYRGWGHVKSMAIVSPEHPLFASFGGIHHVYANERAERARKEGKPFPAGSTLVFDLLQAEAGQGAYTEGGRKFVAAMVKDDQRYAATGGWGFQAWGEGNPDKPVLQTATEQVGCFGCHQQVKDTGYVFSTWRP